jgi:creatinine amidohydrolase
VPHCSCQLENLAVRPWALADVNYAYLKQNHYEVAVLPCGATEPHNLHLPYGTDLFEGTVVGEKICEAAHNQGAKVALLPTIPYGTETNQMAFPMAMNLNPSTLFAVITDLVKSLEHHGVKKFVLLNSHGGNEFKALVRELFGKTSVNVFLVSWYSAVKDLAADIFDHPDDHAGEMETSFGLAYFPELVARNADGTLIADDGAVAKTRFRAVNEGWVSITRPWHLLTTNSGSGYPHAATAEKGRKLLDAVVERLAPFLVELSNAKLDDKFPF